MFRFECCAYKSDESSNIFTSRPSPPTADNESFSLQASEKWFEQVLAAVDCYIWVFGQNLIAPAKLLSGKLYIYFVNRTQMRTTVQFIVTIV